MTSKQKMNKYNFLSFSRNRKKVIYMWQLVLPDLYQLILDFFYLYVKALVPAFVWKVPRIF